MGGQRHENSCYRRCRLYRKPYLQNAGHEPVILDNLYNASPKVIGRIEAITGKKVPFYEADIRDREALNRVFDAEKPDAVIHFAGLKAVGESVHKPWEYYDNNITGTLTLLDVMRKHNCRNIIFSSSATVYGDPAFVPITEECPKGTCTNPYGWTKWMLEQILTDMHTADPEWNVILLRYFNPIGAHPSGTMGENPNGIPNNLMPYITQVAVGKLEKLHVFGNDYDTPDGTGVRDYIHVVDLAKGHVCAVSLTLFTISRKRPERRFRMSSTRAEPATSRPATAPRRRHRRNSAGPRSTESAKCARIPGAGRV